MTCERCGAKMYRVARPLSSRWECYCGHVVVVLRRRGES